MSRQITNPIVGNDRFADVLSLGCVNKNISAIQNWSNDIRVACHIIIKHSDNNAWYARCLEWLKIGLEILDDAHVTADHKASRDAVLDYLKTHDGEPTLGGVLILDAVTVHDGELNRISRTLR